MGRTGAVVIALAVALVTSGCAGTVAARTAASSAAAESQSPSGAVTPPSDEQGRPVGPGETSASPVPRPSASAVPASWWPKHTGNVVYLTFDDGPWPTTHEVLDVLRANDARATFFQIGSMIDDYGSITPRLLAEGHAIGNHTYDHLYLNKLSDELVRYQLEKAWRTIGYDRQGPCVRPPFGAAGSRQRKIAVDMGLTPVFWTIDTRDWANPSEDAIYKQIISARSGSIVLMHDGGGDRRKTIAALRRALPVLKKRGFRFDVVPVCVVR